MERFPFLDIPTQPSAQKDPLHDSEEDHSFLPKIVL